MFSIKLDYTFDISGFFNYPERREVISYAAELWSEVINDNFPEVPKGSVFQIRHPSIANEIVDVELGEDISDLLIYVGARDISGNTLGLGGPAGYSLVGDEFTLRISENFRDQGPTQNFEPWAGVLTFDKSANWNFSLGLPGSDENDLLTVALHEIGHVLGIGTSATFNALVDNQAFDGKNTVGLNNGSALPLYSDEAHVEDGFDQNDVLMDPTTTVGDRVRISDIDKAILSDLGYEIDGFEVNSTTFDLVTTSGETVNGSLLSDLINALDGDDLIFGDLGADELYGGAGDDQVQGGKDDDLIFGNEGNDTLFGEDGDDKIHGNAGSDQLQGGSGNDVLIGGDGDDNIYGGEDNDVISVGSGSDLVQAGSGNDIVVSEFGEDNIWLDEGNDTVYVFCNGNSTWLNDYNVLDDALYIVGSNFNESSVVIENAFREYSNYWTVDLGNQTKLRIKGDDDTFLNSKIELVSDWRLEDYLSEKKIISVDGGEITSSDAGEIFELNSKIATLYFKKVNDVSQGADTIKQFNKSVHKIIFENYDQEKIVHTLDSNGDDFIIFEEDNGESSLTIKAYKEFSALKLNKLKNHTIEIAGSKFMVDEASNLLVSENFNFTDVKISSLRDLKSTLKKSNDTHATDPINLSDVLTQLKHIVGLKELSANSFQAGDTNNDGVINLSDVLDCLKHIVGLKELDTFDLVTDNGFAINSLNSDSNGNLSLVINGDADQGHADWIFA